MGYSEDDAQAMEKLQNDMKKYNGGDDNEIVLESNAHQLPHHDMMLPHWQKLATSLKRRNFVNYEVQIKDIFMPIPVLDVVFPTFQSTNLNDLLLYNVGLGSVGYQYIASFLNENSTLEKLALGADEIVVSSQCFLRCIK